MIALYYPNDSDVMEDAEVQAWIKDVTEEGFADVPHFGQLMSLLTPPSCLCSLDETEIWKHFG